MIPWNKRLNVQMLTHNLRMFNTETRPRNLRQRTHPLLCVFTCNCCVASLCHVMRKTVSVQSHDNGGGDLYQMVDSPNHNIIVETDY